MSEKKVWFITGCSTGFGRELAKQLLENGYRVVVTARDAGKIQDLVEINTGNALALNLDVTDAAQVADSVKRAEAHFGKIDVLVNNAGFGYFGAIEESDEREVRAMFEANFWGLAEMTRAVLPKMREEKSGTIVNISSIGGFVGNPGVGYYNATKFAVNGFFRSLVKGSRAARNQGCDRSAVGFSHRLGGTFGERSDEHDCRLRRNCGQKSSDDSRLQRQSTRRSGARRKGDYRSRRIGKSAVKSVVGTRRTARCADESRECHQRF